MDASRLDFDSRGLECGAVQRNGEDESLGGSLFRCTDDVWQLRPLQSAGGHSRRRLFS